MDDFDESVLRESKNDIASRVIDVLLPRVVEGFDSIFLQAWEQCVATGETSKVLSAFQTLLSNVGKWNANVIEDERKRIIAKSGCNYLEDLITCAHVLQVKILTSVRVSNATKKINVSTPNLDAFLHKVFINSARLIYKRVYVYEKLSDTLKKQRNRAELESMITSSILKTIRDGIPTESIIRAYLDNATEHEEEVIIENLPVGTDLVSAASAAPSAESSVTAVVPPVVSDEPIKAVESVSEVPTTILPPTIVLHQTPPPSTDLPIAEKPVILSTASEPVGVIGKSLDDIATQSVGENLAKKLDELKEVKPIFSPIAAPFQQASSSVADELKDIDFNISPIASKPASPLDDDLFAIETV